MRFVRTAIIAGVATAALAGAALAAHKEPRMMLLAHPDGSVEHIPIGQEEFAPEPASPVDLFEAAFGPASAFAEMDRMAAAMEAETAIIMRQAAAMDTEAPARQGSGIVMTNAQGKPVGVMHYSFVSSSTDANGCTETISYSSDGASAPDQPRVVRTSAGSCASQAAPAPTIASMTRAPVPVAPTAARPVVKPAPKLIPVSATKSDEVFTPSRT